MERKVGISGHGLVVWPRTPFQAGREANGALWVASNGMLAIEPGGRPATESPDSIASDQWRCGPGGPVITLRNAFGIEDVVKTLELRLDDADWTVRMDGGRFTLPPRVVVESPPEDERYPTLLLRDPDHRGVRTIDDAKLGFEDSDRPAHAIVVDTGYGAPELALPTPRGTVRCWEYTYYVRDRRFHKREYALPRDEHGCLMLIASAPANHAEATFTAADAVAASFSP